MFLLVVPLASIAFALAWLAVPESSDPEGRHFDLPGQVSGALALGGLALAAITGHDGGYQWIAALLLTALALPLFIWTERKRGTAALVPLDLFRIRPFCGAIIATASMTFGMYGLVFLLPLVLQAEGHFTPAQAGLFMMPTALVFFALSTQSGRLVQRFGVRAIAAGGTAVIGCGSLAVAATSAGSPIWLAQLGLLLTAIGMGLNTGPLHGIAVGSVAQARSGTASALINVARMAGATLGVALLGAVFALLHGGAGGMHVALLIGGLVQLGGAMIAFATIR